MRALFSRNPRRKSIREIDTDTVLSK